MGRFDYDMNQVCNNSLSNWLQMEIHSFSFPHAQILPSGKHELIFYFVNLKEVRKFYKDNPNHSPEDVPTMEVIITLSETEEDIEAVEDLLAKTKKTTTSAPVKSKDVY
jgi:hypothetical protein